MTSNVNARKVCSALLIGLLFALAVPSVAIALPGSDSNRKEFGTYARGSYGEVIDSGTCGNQAGWSMYNSGLLVIDGSGEMSFSGSADSPWKAKYGTSIKAVIVEDGITFICNFAFSGMKNCQYILFKGPQTPGYQKFFDQYALSGLDQSKCTIYCPPGDESWSGGILGFSKPVPWVDEMFAIDWLTMREMGVCGEDAIWVLSGDGSLRVRGTGSVTKSIFPDAKDEVHDFIVEDGIQGLAEGVNVRSDSFVTAIFADSVTSLPESFLAYSDSLKSVELSNSLQSIPYGLLSGCDKLTDVIIPVGCGEIGAQAFSHCTSLESIILPDGLLKIGDSAFYECSDLKVPVLPLSIESIGKYAFRGCAGGEVFIVPSGVRSLGQGALDFEMNRVDFEGAMPEFAGAYYGDEIVATHRAGDESWDVKEKFDFSDKCTWYTRGANGKLSEDPYISRFGDEQFDLTPGQNITIAETKGSWMKAAKFTVDNDSLIRISLIPNDDDSCSHEQITITIKKCEGNKGKDILHGVFTDAELHEPLSFTEFYEKGDYYIEIWAMNSHEPNMAPWLTLGFDYESGFRDVNRSTPHCSDIAWLARTGISEGWVESDGTRTFRGMDTVKRQDMAAFLYRLAGSPKYDAPAKSPFSDVSKSTPHYKEICWLAESGVSEGWAEPGGRRTFRGMASVKRQDMAAFLYRLAGSPKYSAPAKSPFSDVSKETPHYKEICWLAASGVSEGWTLSGGRREFRGMNDVVRQDMAAFLHRMSDKGLVNR